MAALQSGEGRMMIDFVVCAQYIKVTDTQTNKANAPADVGLYASLTALCPRRLKVPMG